jgi:CHAT domain-containing protein
MRHGVHTRDLKQTFFNNRFDPFKAIIALLIKSGNKERALEYADRAKAAALRDDLSSIRWSRFSNNKAVDENPSVEYIFTNEGLLIFFSDYGRVEVSFREVSRDAIGRQVNELLSSVRNHNPRAFAGLAKSLYQELIRPVEKYVGGWDARALVILPDGPLHLLPFAGLMDERGSFLLEKIPISYAPSRSVLRYCQSASPYRQAQENVRMLLIDGTRGLPHARDELDFISKIYRAGIRAGTGELLHLERYVQQSEIVHFAGHAVTEQEKTVLILQEGPKQINLDSGMVRRWDLSRAQLVNLAGCSTGIGPVAEGEAPWGLIPAFLNAGAHSIIASLLPVDDESTQKMNCMFYEFLKKGETKAKALQLAQQSLLRTTRQNPDGTPQSWIPYVLIGNPR